MLLQFQLQNTSFVLEMRRSSQGVCVCVWVGGGGGGGVRTPCTLPVEIRMYLDLTLS